MHSRKHYIFCSNIHIFNCSELPQIVFPIERLRSFRWLLRVTPNVLFVIVYMCDDHRLVIRMITFLKILRVLQYDYIYYNLYIFMKKHEVEMC